MKIYKIRSGRGDFNAHGKCYSESDLESLVSNQIYAPGIKELNESSFRVSF